MSQTRRLSQLFAADDWLANYRFLVNADFKAYDFDTLRAAFIDHIKRNYPEDFNDFINSSEYVAIIDLLAFLGQNLAFRSDLNLRESFLETAES
jgi:predicted O-methyltransferase YrrM